ncbi:hypothetical protein LCGC14_1689730 [marine sediment metagenome]|uniref:Uncharacterized protein n=1 Tax=marine sediment metagenome TaxID=412755 RepID=A0A0F9KLB8_9ZZZZ
MSIDTKEKRANVLGVGRPWMRDKFPVATPDEQWRMASGLTYGGNALSAPATGVVTKRFGITGSQSSNFSSIGTDDKNFIVIGTDDNNFSISGA